MEESGGSRTNAGTTGMSVLLLVVCMPRICNQQSKKMAVHLEVAADYRYDLVQLPVFQPVLCGHFDGFSHGRLFGSLLHTEINKPIPFSWVT